MPRDATGRWSDSHSAKRRVLVRLIAFLVALGRPTNRAGSMLGSQNGLEVGALTILIVVVVVVVVVAMLGSW